MGYCVVERNTTMFGERFENEKALELLEKIGKHFPGGFFIYKSTGDEELLYANKAVFEIFGCEDLECFKELTGYTFKGMVLPEDYDSIASSIMRQVDERADHSDHVEYRIMRKDGQIRWIDDYGHFVNSDVYGGIFYVFITDITDKKLETELDKVTRSAVIEALSRVYNSVWLVDDVEKGSFSLYRIDGDEDQVHLKVAQEALKEVDYSHALNHYADSVVFPEDRDRFKQEVSLENVIKNTNDKPIYAVDFRRVFDTGVRYYKTEFAKIELLGGKTGIVAGFKDVDDDIRMQQQLIEEQSKREQRDRMITALASDYRSVYHIDLDNNDGVCYRADPDDKEQTAAGVHFPFYERFKWYAYNSVDEAYRAGFLDYIDPNNIRQRLAKNAIIAYRYLVKRSGKEYYEMIRMAGVRHAEDRDDNIVHAIGLGLTNIDEEMRDSMMKNETLNEALKAAEEANKAKTAFLSNMSHEIRTPMNAIIGLDSLALRKENLDDETREYLSKIGESARHLLGLINDILDMSRIESGRVIIRREEFSFRSMLEQINVMVMTQCSDKGLKYECSVTGGVADYYIGDDMKLKQVLINILSNAIKFTEAPGSVSLKVERTAVFDNQSTIKFKISDTGIGMDESFIPKVFDTFTQEDSSRNNKYGSTGLGMAITKNIVDIMNGTIAVESKKGVGTTFTVIVTLKNCAHDMSEGVIINPKDIHVLVVDDEEIAAEHARIVLDEAGIKADTCLNGKDALHMLEVQHTKMEPYNLVLLDWKMPDMDGIELAREIRGLYDKETTVIILTSFNWDEIMDEALHTGVDSFLAKPLFASNVIGEFERIARKNNMEMFKEKERADLDGRRVLLAEDIIINAEIMKELLAIKGINICHAENGKIALELFDKSELNYYDAILMDVRMPEMDGLEATKAIRALDRSDSKRVPIIAMTANAFDEDVQRSLQIGMNAHLSKPVEPERLYRTLGEMIWEAEHTN